MHHRGNDGSLDEGLHPIPVVTEGEREIMRTGGSGGFTTMIEYSSKLPPMVSHWFSKVSIVIELRRIH
jgi:hypothetical protein